MPSAPRPAFERWRAGGHLDRYLLRTLARPLVGSLGFAVAALLLEKALRLVAALSAEGGRLVFVLPLMSDLAPYYFAIAAPVAFFAALLIVFSALDEAGEVEAMLSAGLSLDRIAAPFVLVGGVVALLTLGVSGWLEPLGRYAFGQGQTDAARAGWVGKLESGKVFSPREGVALEADHVAQGGRLLKNVFLARREPSGYETIATAREGVLSLVHCGRDVDLLLRDGRIVHDDPDSQTPIARFEVLEQFEPSGTNDGLARSVRGGDERELTLPELIAGTRDHDPVRRRVVSAELATKLARGAVVPFLPLLALPLALAGKRGGRGAGVLVAGALLAAFHHALQLCKGLAVNAGVDAVGPIWTVAALFAALCLGVHLASRQRPGDNPVTRATAFTAPLAKRVRGGIERFAAFAPRLPGRQSLSGYVTRIMAARTIAAAAGLFVFLQVVDLQDMGPKILARGLGLGGIANYTLLSTPATALQIAGVAVLLGGVFTFLTLGRRSESVAMQASGVSPYRILLAALPMAAGVAALDLALSCEIAPRAQATLDDWWLRTTPAAERVISPPRWFGARDAIASVDAVTPKGKRLTGLQLYRRAPGGAFTERVVADTADWSKGWRLTGVTVHRPEGVSVTHLHAAAAPWRGGTPSPADMRAMLRRPEQTASSAALWTVLSRAPTDKSFAYLGTRLNRIIAQPLSPLVMLLLASPVLVGAGMRRSRAPQLAFALAGGLLYLVSDGLLTALGEAGDLPPIVAAWAAPVLFAGAGATALLFAEG